MTCRFLKNASVCISFLFISTLPAVALDRIMGHGGPVKDVVVSPNDQLLASVSFDYSVVLWDTQSFQESHRLLGLDHGPDIVTPGSKMPIQVIKNDSDLNDLVLFLKIATAPQN